MADVEDDCSCWLREIQVIQDHLLNNCLCSLPENIRQKWFTLFQSPNVSWVELTSDWSTDQVLMLITCVQLICDKMTKQSDDDYVRVCSKIFDLHNALTRKENDLIDYFIELADDSEPFISFAAGRAVVSFFLIVRSRMDQRWLDKITNYIEHSSQPCRMSFALDVLKRIIEWKDFSEHTLEDGSSGTSTANDCHILTMHSEQLDSTQVKYLCIQALETKWPNIVRRFATLISSNLTTYQASIVTFLNLWEAIIAIKTSVSVIHTTPFYYSLEEYFKLLFNNKSPIIWKQILSLFMEILCYGSTLALQHDLAREPCSLAHVIVKNVKDGHLLRHVPYSTGKSGFGSDTAGGDRILLKKLVLLILKAVAVTVKEAKYDSSSDESSIESEHEDGDGDMALICRSIHDVLKKLDSFIKEHIDFHPETRLAQWIVQLFTDQDDYLVESMICCVDVARVLCNGNNVSPELKRDLNPGVTFLEFLIVVRFETDVLLDFLLSREIFFLHYILKFLKYLRDHWDEFVCTCGYQIQNVMNSMIKLRETIERLVAKNLFPYDIGPILTLLIECEERYCMLHNTYNIS